jgi:hypothetical protein
LFGSKAKAVGAAVPSSVVAAAETGLRTAGTLCKESWILCLLMKFELGGVAFDYS